MSTVDLDCRYSVHTHALHDRDLNLGKVGLIEPRAHKNGQLE